MKFCNECGQRVFPGSKYCPNCGINLIKEEKSEVIAPVINEKTESIFEPDYSSVIAEKDIFTEPENLEESDIIEEIVSEESVIAENNINESIIVDNVSVESEAVLEQDDCIENSEVSSEDIASDNVEVEAEVTEALEVFESSEQQDNLAQLNSFVQSESIEQPDVIEEINSFEETKSSEDNITIDQSSIFEQFIQSEEVDNPDTVESVNEIFDEHEETDETEPAKPFSINDEEVETAEEIITSQENESAEFSTEAVEENETAETSLSSESEAPAETTEDAPEDTPEESNQTVTEEPSDTEPVQTASTDTLPQEPTEQETKLSKAEEKARYNGLINSNIDATGNAAASFFFISASIMISLYIVCTVFRSTAVFLGLPFGFVSPYVQSFNYLFTSLISYIYQFDPMVYKIVVFALKLVSLIPIIVFAIGMYAILGVSDERPIRTVGFRLIRFDLITKLIVTCFLFVLVLASYGSVFVNLLRGSGQLELSFEGLPFTINPVYVSTFIVASGVIAITVIMLAALFFLKAAGTFKSVMQIGETGVVAKKKISIYASVICILIALVKIYSIVFNAVNFSGEIGHILLMVEYGTSALFYIFIGICGLNYRGNLKITETKNN